MDLQRVSPSGALFISLWSVSKGCIRGHSNITIQYPTASMSSDRLVEERGDIPGGAKLKDTAKVSSF